MFNVVLCNSYLLSSIESQERFRVLLYQQLLQVGTSTWKRKWVDLGLELELFQETLTPDVRGTAVQAEHRQVHRNKSGECQGCHITGTSRAPNKRRVLGELSLNVRNNSRPKRSNYGCLACDLAFCKEGPCYQLYHEQNVDYQ
jgi:hypothetical protein